MNAKQRKQAEKIRERALLDSGNTMSRIVAERARLEAYMLTVQQEAEKNAAMFKQERADLDALTEQRRKEWEADQETGKGMIAAQLAAIDAERILLQEKGKNFKDGTILRDVLLQLEMDIPPQDIANNLRHEHNLLVPQW
ncbi:MAG: hypothetical protein RR740_00390 [Pseudomonas sp.]